MIIDKIKLAQGSWHWFMRFVSWLIMFILIIGMPVGAGFFVYQKGVTKGYSLCYKDKSTYTGQNINVFEGEKKPLLLGIKIGKVGLGLIWDRDK